MGENLGRVDTGRKRRPNGEGRMARQRAEETGREHHIHLSGESVRTLNVLLERRHDGMTGTQWLAKLITRMLELQEQVEKEASI